MASIVGGIRKHQNLLVESGVGACGYVRISCPPNADYTAKDRSPATRNGPRGDQIGLLWGARIALVERSERSAGRSDWSGDCSQPVWVSDGIGLRGRSDCSGERSDRSAEGSDRSAGAIGSVRGSDWVGVGSARIGSAGCSDWSERPLPRAGGKHVGRSARGGWSLSRRWRRRRPRTHRRRRRIRRRPLGPRGPLARKSISGWNIAARAGGRASPAP